MAGRAWTCLIPAGLFEIGWPADLKWSIDLQTIVNNFQQPI